MEQFLSVAGIATSSPFRGDYDRPRPKTTGARVGGPQNKNTAVVVTRQRAQFDMRRALNIAVKTNVENAIPSSFDDGN